MLVRALLLCVPWTILLATVAAAGEPAVVLPKDGEWSRFFFTSRHSTGGDPITGTTTMQFVGTRVENGERCRWIELIDETVVDGRLARSVTRMLVPESDLREAKQPLAGCLRMWTKHNDEAPTLYEDLYKADLHYGRGFVWLPGVLSTEVESTPRVIEYQQGTWRAKECRHGRYKASYVAKTGDVKVTFDTEYRVWLHPESPFRMAAATLKTGVQRNGKTSSTLETEFVLEDFGSGAKGVLADRE